MNPGWCLRVCAYYWLTLAKSCARMWYNWGLGIQGGMIGGNGEWHVVVDMQLVRFLDWKEVVEVALKAYRPFSQERLRTLPQRASDTVDLRWFLFDESYQCLWQPSPSQDLQFWKSHFSSINFYLKPEWVTDLAADTNRQPRRNL